MAVRSAREFRERLAAGERFLADGGMGSELMRLGVAAEDIVHANSAQPESVTAIHERYLAAGAQILTTNTFGLRNGGDWAQDIRAGLSLTSDAARKRLSDVGFWLSLIPSQVVPEQERLRSLFSHSLHRPEILLLETCVSLKAGVEAANAARSLQTELLIVTCHFEQSGRMPDGTTPEAAAQALTEAGADIVGGNCGETPEAFIAVAARMRAATDVPLLFQPSAGLPEQQDDGSWHYPVTPKAFADAAMHLYEAGVSIVGGCCGTTPAHIAATRARMRAECAP